MKSAISPTISVGLLVVLLALTLSAARLALSATSRVSSLAVAVFPKTMVLDRDQGTSVTVHAKIPFRTVRVASLTLNGIAAKGASPDKRGELVAYFDSAAVKKIVSVPYTTLTLRGVTAKSATFWGSDTVQVIPGR